jgi:hypothetical protein
MTAMSWSIATFFAGEASVLPPRPRRLSGLVTIATTLTRASRSARRTCAEMSGVPKKTTSRVGPDGASFGAMTPT